MLMGGAGLSCRPVAAVTATTTTPNSIHKMSETEEEEKMTRFLSTVDSFLSASRRRERELALSGGHLPDLPFVEEQMRTGSWRFFI